MTGGGAVSGSAFRTFYRVVKAQQPIRDDFLTSKARGVQPRRNDPELLRIWDSVSVCETEDQARDLARKFVRMGTWIAKLEVPATIRAERTLPASPGHYSLWATPDELLQCVVDIVPVDP